MSVDTVDGASRSRFGAARVRVLIPVYLLMSMVSACSDGTSTQVQAGTAAAQAAGAPAFAGGAPSIDVLLDQLLHAVQARDEQAVHSLRVSEQEYRSIIVPWTVDEHEAPRMVSAKTTDYFWRSFDTKNRYFVAALLDEFGGHTLLRKNLEYTKGVQKYGGYTAYGKVRMVVEDEQGRRGVLRSGTIAEVQGQYKFIGLNWDD